MEKMKKTDEPQLVSGCMRWGKWGKQLSKEQMASLINDLIENGIHFFDHEDIYGEYTTEAEFGNAVKYLGMARQNYHICTKLGLQIPGEKRRTNIKHYQYDHDHIINSVNSSISKLDCEHIDALLLHRPSPLMNEMKVVQAINELKKAGRIRLFGVSNWNAFQLETMLSYTDIAFNQIELSLTNSNALENGTIDKMKEFGIKLMAWKPLGDLYQRNKDDKLVKAVDLIAYKYQVSSSTIMINWLLQLPLPVYPVFGSTNIERIKEMQKAYTFNINREEWFYLWEMARGKEVD